MRMKTNDIIDTILVLSDWHMGQIKREIATLVLARNEKLAMFRILEKRRRIILLEITRIKIPLRGGLSNEDIIYAIALAFIAHRRSTIERLRIVIKNESSTHAPVSPL